MSPAVPEVPGYVVGEVVGRGPSATVYRAVQTAVDRPVAVKVLQGGAAGADLRAVRALAGHPHVVEVIDTGVTSDGLPFVVMDLVTAGSLGDRLRAFGPLTPTAAARAGAEVADALEAAHAAGIVHGRVSPDNVLVGRRGQALLADFGAAPGATPADDVHDLGATLHALVTGAAPPAGEAPPLPPEVPFALVDLIGASTAHDPARRPSLAEVATVLEAIAADRAVPPDPVAEPDPASEPGPAALATATGGSSDDAPPRRVRSSTPPGVPVTKMVVVSVLIALSMLSAVVLTLLLD